MALTPEERERIYLEEKARLEFVHQTNAGPDDSKIPSALAFIGVTLLVVGLALAIYFCFIFTITVPVNFSGASRYLDVPTSVNNLGLMSDRQTGLVGGGILALLGAGALLAGLLLRTQRKGFIDSTPLVAYSAALIVVSGGILFSLSHIKAKNEDFTSSSNFEARNVYTAPEIPTPTFTAPKETPSVSSDLDSSAKDDSDKTTSSRIAKARDTVNQLCKAARAHNWNAILQLCTDVNGEGSKEILKDIKVRQKFFANFHAGEARILDDGSNDIQVDLAGREPWIPYMSVDFESGKVNDFQTGDD
jgi:hypothetical protein